jgi:hypothetical protein
MCARSGVVAAALALAVAHPVPADAHAIGPRFVPVFDGTSPAKPGVTLEPAATGAMPHVVLRIAGAHTLEVSGPLSEPFVRIDRSGAFVNAATPSAALLNEQAKLPRHPPGASPRWRRVSSSRSLGWYEPRAEFPYKAAPALVRKRGRRATVYRWSIPTTYDGAPVELRGHVDWVPAPFDPTSLVLVGAAVVGLVYVLVGGRRRARKAGL